MPGIYLFKRYWSISSDDFVFPSFAELCLRSAWLLIISILFGIHQGSFGCPNGILLRNYYIGAIVLLSVGIVHTAFTMVISMRGTIRDSYPRRHINYLLYLKIAILLPEAVWVIVATYWAFGFSFTCEWHAYWAARAAVICAWIVGFFMFVGILLVFDPLGSAKDRQKIGDSVIKRDSEYLIAASKSQNSRVWETRCRYLCCCIAHSQDTENAFSDVARVVAGYFKGIDLVPTDIAAGLMLVSQQQQSPEGDLTTITTISTDKASSSQSANIVAQSTVMTDRKSAQDCMTIPWMAHYMKFALGSYGWPFFMYSRFFTGLCRLCAACRCCGCIRVENQVYSDNSCECHTAAIRQLTKIKNEDLIYVTFHNKYRETPFYVAVDRKFNNVVVSIRGTLSAEDALTDLSAHGAPLEIDGVPEATCHEAMLDCAEYIKSQLQEKRLLEQAFARLQEGSRLVLAGHSLGGGVAAILAVLLRPLYNNLICFTYSPPGGLMSPSASHYARDFVCSVIVGEDIIPRLTMLTMCDLKIRVLRALYESHKPKYQIFATGCFHMLCSCLLTPQSAAQQSGESSLLTNVQHGNLPSYTTPLLTALKAAEEYAKEMQLSEWPTHPPGRILHVVEQKEDRVCAGDPQYTAVWAQPENFNSIIISHRMVLDHFPDTMLQALDQLNDRNFVPPASHVHIRSVNQAAC